MPLTITHAPKPTTFTLGPFTLTYAPEPTYIIVTEENIRASFPGLFGGVPIPVPVQPVQPPNAADASRPEQLGQADAAIAAQDRIMATQSVQPVEDKIEQSAEETVPSEEELLALVKHVTDTPSLGLSHVKEVQKSLGGKRVSLMEPTEKIAFATALRDALALRAVV